MTEHTGGMLALVPDNPGRLAVDGGEDPSEIHLTLLYLGDDVTTWPEGQADRLREIMAASAPALDAVTARIIGHGVFNPDGHEGREPCAVYLVGDTPDIEPLRRWAQWVLTTHDEYATPPEQHTPYIPHITAGYDLAAEDLSYVGPVRFGTLRLALAGSVLDMPLGDEEAPVSGPQIKSITFTPSQEVRDAAAELELVGDMATAVIEGKALDAEGLVWVAAHCGQIGQQWAAEMLDRVEVKRAGMRMGAIEGGDRPKLDETDELPEHGDTPEEDRPPHVRKRKRHTTAAAEVEPPELKAMSPSPAAAKLREFWAHTAKGRGKWKPGVPGDFKRLRRHLAKYVKSPRILNGLTANIHKLATGEWPGKNAHTVKGNVGKKLVTAGKGIDWDAIEVKVADLVDVDLDALHDGVDDWGSIFDEAGTDDYLTSLGDPPEDAPAEDDGTRTAQFAALNLVADEAPGGTPEGDWPNLFDAPPAPAAEPVTA